MSGRLSTSCPSLNESCEAIILDDNTSNTTDNSTSMQQGMYVVQHTVHIDTFYQDFVPLFFLDPINVCQKKEIDHKFLLTYFLSNFHITLNKLHTDILLHHKTGL